MRGGARAHCGPNFIEGARSVYKMPCPACWCRIHWTSPDAHCWNAVEHRKAWHGQGCRCRTCWDNARRMCAADRCRGRQVSEMSPETRDYVGECAACHRRNSGRRWDPEPRQGDTQPEPEEDPEVESETVKNEEFCYKCHHYTYLGRNFCSNPSCKRKGPGPTETSRSVCKGSGISYLRTFGSKGG